MKTRAVSLLLSLAVALLCACGSGSDSGRMASAGGAMATGGGSSCYDMMNMNDMMGMGDMMGMCMTPMDTSMSSSGSISAFGSVFINGNHFNVSGAQITIDDEPATEQDLQVGYSATITGSGPTGSGLALAALVAVRSQVVGPVTSVDTAANTFIVLGQTVRVRTDTLFDPVIAPADITGIHAADLVVVHGAVAADGSISARRIGRASAAMGLRVAGTVTSLNTTNHTFRLNALTVDFTSATLLGFGSGAPANGDSVRVRGTAFAPATTTLTATTTTRALPMMDAAAATVEVEGLVTRFASLTDFDVGGQKVTTTSATRYINGSSGDIALNADVEARGTVNSAGVLTAGIIDVHNNGRYVLNAPITALNAAAGTVTVLGVTVSVNSMTRLADLSGARVRNFAFGDVRIGDNVAVAGYEKPVASGQLTATLLTRLPASAVVAVSGPFTATTAPQFSILGVTVNAATATFYADRNTTISSAAFFAQAAGRQVAVTGATGSSGGSVVATRVALLPPDID